jgi:hypothetical protein
MNPCFLGEHGDGVGGGNVLSYQLHQLVIADLQEAEQPQ